MIDVIFIKIDKYLKIKSYYMNIMTSELPSYDELTTFISKMPKATICELIEHFNQEGTKVIMDTKRKYVYAYNINDDFWKQLQTYFKLDFVLVEIDIFAVMCSDKTRYIGPGKYIPFVVSIKRKGLFGEYIDF